MYPADVMDDLFYEEAEGLSEMDYDDDFEDEYDDFEAYDDDFEAYDDDSFDDFYAYDEFDDDYDDDLYDAYDAFEDDYDEFDDDYDDDGLDILDYFVAEALDSYDTDEFLKKLRRKFRKVFKKVGKVAKKIGRGVGKVARKVAPIAKLIPLPQAQAVGRIAGIAGKLLADGADELEAIDALADYADYTGEFDAAAPVIAGLAVKKAMPSVATLPISKRKKIVKQTKKAAKILARRQGAKATKAMPKVVQAAKMVTKKTGQPITRTIPKTAAKVAKSPTTTRRLASKVKKVAKMKRMMKGTRKPYPYRMMGSRHRCQVCGSVSVRC